MLHNVKQELRIDNFTFSNQVSFCDYLMKLDSFTSYTKRYYVYQ